jgi:hypothetical protein
VTVAAPVKMLPKMIAGSSNGTMASPRARTRPPHDAWATTGQFCRWALRDMRSISTPAKTMAGSKPARKRAVTEMSAIVARITISKQGGTRMPIADAALTIETASSRL